MSREFSVQDFVDGDVSLPKIKQLRKAELKEVATHVGVELDPKFRKDELIDTLARHFKLVPVDEAHSKADVSLELARIELEKLRLETQSKQLELRKAEIDLESRQRQTYYFDVAKNTRLVPKFHEGEVDSFFSAFEKMAKRLDWPTEYWTVLVQTALTGKAQEVFSSLSELDSEDYDVVKAVIVSAYELVPEAYRQRFREARKKPGQTYVELAREKSANFDRWISSLKVPRTYDSLREVMTLESFKDSLPSHVRAHIEEQKGLDLRNAAIVADEFDLLHRSQKCANGGFAPKWKRADGGAYPVKPNRNFGKGIQSQPMNKPDSSSKSGSSDTKSDRPDFRSDENPNRVGGKREVTCQYCSKKGHVKTQCWKLQRDGKKQGAKPVLATSGERTRVDVSGHGRPEDMRRANSPGSVDNLSECYRSFMSKGEVSWQSGDGAARPVRILRDTGAAQSLLVGDVSRLPADGSACASALIQGIEGSYISVPLYRIHLKSDLLTGVVTVGVVPGLPMDGVDLLMGNDLAGGKVSVSPIVSSVPVVEPEIEELQEEFPGIFPACVVTRSQSGQVKHDEADDFESVDDSVRLAETFFANLDDVSAQSNEGEYCRSSLIAAQQKDATLQRLLLTAVSEEEAAKTPECFYLRSGVLMRKWRPPNRPASESWSVVHQIVLPVSYRREILRVAHEVPMGGHVGIRKTQSRVMKYFYWPKLHKDVVDFCKTCHTCQVVGKPQPSIKPAPLIPIPAVGEPFSRVLIDCVGPLPRTKSGNKYLLTIMDVSTRFPEAIPMKKVTAKAVVDALLQFFTRYGLPKEIQSDQGSNFMSGLFQEVMHELGVRQLKSTAYHPQSQGAIERFHQTFKTMLKTYCEEHSEDWDRGVAFLLFAVRDSPGESTGYSPFELVYGHEVRGPLKLIKEMFLEVEDDAGKVNVLDYVSEFKGRLSSACDLAKEHLQASQQKMKNWADQKAEKRSFKPGDKVLVLLPFPGEPLKAKFSGPYVVSRKLNEVNYIITTPDRRKRQRVCHINMIKMYHERADEPVVGVTTLVGNREGPPEPEDMTPPITEPLTPKLSNSLVLENLQSKLGHLTEEQSREIGDLLREYPQICTDKPGRTTLVTHHVNVEGADPIKQHPYRLSPEKRHQVREEVKKMLDDDIIEPSNSAWSSPIVMVPKPDGSNRFCIDYRKVNKVTKTDSYPLPRLEDCIDQIGNAKFVTKIDLLKGYWQVPLSDEAREISAFVTPDGLFQSKVMPFGLKNAPATFQRLMNDVTRDVDGCVVYIDDVVVYSDTWESHIRQLRALFDKLSEANLVINLQKSEFTKAQVTYLGHVVGQGHVSPREAKIEAILAFPPPRTKREILRFLGMCGFYRRFVHNFSTIAAPLTNLLKKGKKFVWSSDCQTAFESLKAILTRDPVLVAPDFGKPFKLAVDASDVGVGAVLFQSDGNQVDRPVSYFSRKLNGHQQKYSTVEKETLGLVLALQHFSVYTGSGGGDIQVYTDHNPLSFLEKFKSKNGRLFRWSLLLQPFSLKIAHISGRANIIPDALSRV
ncbi:uncharacterized protein [Diadema setosum]|uniref:uncharacterized protein n=1 Tax=Diadema setosum TaxID=31175 RepID=UPI003B3A6653